MDDGNNWLTTLGIRTESSFRIRRLFKNESRRYRVTFKFYCETVSVNNRTTSGDMTTYSFVHYLIANKNFSAANLRSMQSAIETQLIIWSLPLFEHVPLIVVTTMMKIECKRNSLDNDFLVQIGCARILRHIQGLDYNTLDGDVLDLPRTDESTTRNLDCKVMLSNGECVICLNELPAGCEAASMPCAHPFHGDCIQNWLRINPCCPVCRFEIQD